MVLKLAEAKDFMTFFTSFAASSAWKNHSDTRLSTLSKRKRSCWIFDFTRDD